jgi:NAD+ kinase
LLGVARENAKYSPILIGVNFGNLGFLTEISPNELIKTLEAVLSDKAKIGTRSMLQAQCYRNGKLVFDIQAFNDIIVQKGTRSRLLELDVFMNSIDIMRIRGDGLIFATPTGSTAYSMAAGGSIAYPSLDVILLTPICPHSLTNRPIILPNKAKLEVNIPDYDGDVYISSDAQAAFTLQTGDRVEISDSPHKARIALSDKHDYFSILRSKLNWSIPNLG